jgi:hypothetical protein
MLFSKIKLIAQAIEFTCIALLALLCALTILGGGDLARADAFAANTVPAGANGLPRPTKLEEGGQSVPLLLDYQGTLRDIEGNPLSDYYTMTFRL